MIAFLRYVPRAAVFCACFAVASDGFAQTLNCPPAPNRVKVKVTADVSFDATSQLYTYSYTVFSDPSSEQEVKTFSVDFAPPISNPQRPKGWSRGKYSFRNTFNWGAIEVADPDVVDGTAAIPPSIVQIKPGKSLSGFSFQSPKPPGPVKYYVTGYVAITPATSEEEAETLSDTCPELGHELDMAAVGITQGPVDVLPAATLLFIDEDSITKGETPNSFSDADVNEADARLGQRRELTYFDTHEGGTLTLHTGQIGNEGWFALKSTPLAWKQAGPTDDGLRNYVGQPSRPYPHNVGPGLGTGNDPESALDKIPGVTPLRATGLSRLEGKKVCAVVYKGDIGINYDPLNASLKGDTRGTVAFEVRSVTPLTGGSSSALPAVHVTILDAEKVCEGPLALFQDAPEPTSSSEPADTGR